MILRVEGIVIRAVDYGEGNRILHVLTQEAGKISMMAGERRNSKVASPLFHSLLHTDNS